MISGAVINGQYRYSLWRQWGDDIDHTVCWVMLNPSTADGTTDDPTIRRCISFSQAWGYDGLVVVNRFALRATDPKELLVHPDPFGSNNNLYLDLAVDASELVVAAWGNHHVRGYDVPELLGRTVYCLGTNKNGSPKHPLYLAADTPLEVWRP